MEWSGADMRWSGAQAKDAREAGSGSLGGDLGVGGRGEEEERHTSERGTGAHREKRLARLGLLRGRS